VLLVAASSPQALNSAQAASKHSHPVKPAVLASGLITVVGLRCLSAFSISSHHSLLSFYFDCKPYNGGDMMMKVCCYCETIPDAASWLSHPLSSAR
jgi:hypothetical protein